MNLLDPTHSDPYVQAFPELVQFWEASAQGRFLLPRCRSCEHCHWHPRAICPFCGLMDIDWIEATGNGEVYSFSIIRRRDQAAYVLAYIEVEEGVQLMSNIVGCDPDRVHIGMPVKVAFTVTEDGRWVPVFGPTSPVG